MRTQSKHGPELAVEAAAPGPGLAVEAAAFGLGYVAVLVWAGTALVASFGKDLASPYWPAIPHLRTDTTGVIAFGVAAVCLAASRYLQLRRRNSAPPPPAPPQPAPVPRRAGVLGVQAVAETAAVLSTGVVAYLSFNAVTHPYTLRLQLTHLWPWPSEGTVRVLGLAICLVCVAASRYLRASAGQAGAGHARPVDPARPAARASESSDDSRYGHRGTSAAQL